MRGSIKKRYRASYSLILDLGYVVDPVTGRRKRRQQWITFRGTRKQAETRLAELVASHGAGTFVAPHRRTLGAWLDEWVEKAIKPPRRTLRAYETYQGAIRNHLKPALGAIGLQALTPLDVESWHAASTLAPATKAKHHTILNSALKAAVRAGLLQRNVAELVANKPQKPGDHADVLTHCWEAHEARRFLQAARDAGPQPAAFYTLALETGMRKGELCGLKWTDLDVDGGRVTVQRQLIAPGAEPVFGPVKNRVARTLELSAELVNLLKVHRQRQAEVKMANRTRYRDHGLLFAKDWNDVQRQHDCLGDPLQANNLGQREFARLIKAAGVRPIKFHGLRHTCATLLLQAGTPPNVVQKRLGHKKVEMTLNVYAHALPSMQQDAAQRLSALLGG